MSTTKHPEVLWAQRSSETDASKNIIYLTVNLPDLKEDTVKYELTSNKLSFKGTTGSPGESPVDYAFDLELFGEVVPEESVKRLTTRHFVAVLRKKDLKLEYWPRLTKEKIRLQWLRTDFEKWADEDEQDAKADLDTDGMEGMGGMGGLGGMGGMGGMDMEKLMSQMGGMGGASALDPSSLGGAPDDSDEDDDGPPPLEAADAPK
ncbi:HSP20-like chaperone [Rhizoctonia solani]|nr:HSP20-like chaperone [Rhizoctonia solani]